MDAQGWAKVVTAQQIAKNVLKRSERFKIAHTVSSTVIDGTDASKQIRFTDVSSLVDTYNAMVDNPVEISKDMINDETFCTLWLKMHNNLVDKFYINYGEAAIRKTKPSTTTTSIVDDNDSYTDFSWCTMELAIDPAKQEELAKRPKHRRPKTEMVTKEMVAKVLAEVRAETQALHIE